MTGGHEETVSDVSAAPKNTEAFTVNQQRRVVVNIYAIRKNVFLITLIILKPGEEYSVSSVITIDV